MRTSSSPAGKAMHAVVDAVEVALAPVGWRRRQLANALLGDTFTLDVGDGIIATAELRRPMLSFPQWPASVWIELGVGFEPALGLMPLVAVPAMPMLVHNPASDGDAREIELEGEQPDQRAAAVREIVAFISDHAAAFATGYNRESMADRLRHQAEREAAETDSEWWQRCHVMMLAVLGRRDEAETLLAAYERRYTSGAGSRYARRFARQLRRRLADMPSPIPAAEDTIAQLPAPPPRRNGPKPSVDARWRRDRDRAIKEVKSRAGGHSLAELREMLAREYEVADLDVPASAIALVAETIDAERKPLGGVEFGLRHLWQVGSAVGGVIRTFSSHRDTIDPEWMNPPDRAAFEIKTSNDRLIPISVDTDAHAYLSRARADGVHVGGFAPIPVWLAAPDPAAAELVVHLGGRRIGTVLAADISVLAPAFRAAAIFDEEVALRAHLYQTTDGVDIVELWAGDLHTAPDNDQPTPGVIDKSQREPPDD